MSETKEKKGFFKRAFFYGVLQGKTHAQKIALVAVSSAFVVVANVFEFKMMDTQFSFTLTASALVGVLLGGVFGFVAAFLGDLIGFLYNGGGYAYMPWIGLTMGLTAFLGGAIVHGISLPFKGGLYVKLSLVCLLSLFFGTVAINTTAFWLLYSGGGVPYWTYLVTRLFLKGQIFNCLFNYVIFFAGVPLLQSIKPLKMKIR